MRFLIDSSEVYMFFCVFLFSLNCWIFKLQEKMQRLYPFLQLFDKPKNLQLYKSKTNASRMFPQTLYAICRPSDDNMYQSDQLEN